MERNYNAEQLEILRLNQHLRGKMTDEQILQLGKDFDDEQNFEDNCTPETLKWLSQEGD